MQRRALPLQTHDALDQLQVLRQRVDHTLVTICNGARMFNQDQGTFSSTCPPSGFTYAFTCILPTGDGNGTANIHDHI